jgi:tRNA threonylcarbamoyladenosine biosynthesis protein TsaB
MLTLTIRTDKPEAELGLFENNKQLGYETWHAHRLLAETIHKKIQYLLKSHNKDLHDVQGIIVFKGPGSFTGLRIGVSVANALADSLTIPIIGEKGDGWLKAGIEEIEKSQNQRVVLPEYGSPPHVTKPKH